MDEGLDKTIEWYETHRYWWEKYLWMRKIPIVTPNGKKNLSLISKILNDMKNYQSVSLCMIVRDEEENLPRCLNSVYRFKR